MTMPGTEIELSIARLQVVSTVRMETGCSVRAAYEASMFGLTQASTLWATDYDRWLMVWVARAVEWVKMHASPSESSIMGPLPYQEKWWDDWDLARGLETEQREEQRRVDDLTKAYPDKDWT